MKRYRNVSADAVLGSVNGLVIENSDGSLLACGDYWIKKSDDGGVTWRNVGGMATGEAGRGIFVTAAGSILCGSIPASGASVGGHIYRSADHGETWASVQAAPRTTSAFWNFCQTNDGSLYASEYNWGLNVADESLIYKSTNDGVTWSVFHTETVVAGAVRHTHWVGTDGTKLFCGFGEAGTPGTIHGGRFFALNADGSLGAELGYSGNGGTKLIKSSTGAYFILGDAHPVTLMAFDPVNGKWCHQVNVKNELGSAAYERYMYAATIGRDGVIYITGSDDDNSGLNYLYASGDDGATWQVLDANAAGAPMGVSSLWASGPSGRLFIGYQSWRYMSLPDYTRAQLKKRFAV